MKPKKIQVELGIPIERWADENRGLIMDSIYYNLSEFIENFEITQQTKKKKVAVKKKGLEHFIEE